MRRRRIGNNSVTEGHGEHFFENLDTSITRWSSEALPRFARATEIAIAWLDLLNLNQAAGRPVLFDSRDDAAFCSSVFDSKLTIVLPYRLHNSRHEPPLRTIRLALLFVQCREVPSGLGSIGRFQTTADFLAVGFKPRIANDLR
jgi:hypothetical protein